LEAMERMEAAERSFRFRSMGGRWRGLVKEHPPREEDLAAGLDYNPETLPPVAMAECSVEPKMTAEEVVDLSEVLSLAQFAFLWDTCRAVNVGDWRPSVEANALARRIVAKAKQAEEVNDG